MSEQQHNPNTIMPEGSQRNTGRVAQTMNIQAAKIVAEMIRTTLGPKGMDKMLVDAAGEVTVTNDGVTILREMDIEHPSAKMIVEIAKTQEDEVGDGTTTAVVLAGELLKRAESLLEQNIHPTIIAKGYRLATEKSLDILAKMGKELKGNEDLLKIATTAMTGKGAENDKEHLSALIVEAAELVSEEKNIDTDNIILNSQVGGSVEESELIKGLVINKNKLHSSMPSKVKGAKIALLDCSLELKSTDTDAKITITDPNQMQAFLDMEEKMLKEMIETISATGANVVICQRGIDELAQYFLAKKGIYTLRRVRKTDLERLAKATGAQIVSDIKDLSQKNLGRSGTVEEIKIGDQTLSYIKECDNPKSLTLLVRGGTEHIIAEVTRALEDALGDVASAKRSGKIVAGAGACEIELAKELVAFAEQLSGREQLAVKAFARSMEIIPKTLAENAGLDPIDVLTGLKAAHEKGEQWMGINVFSGKLMDSWEEGVLEPLQIKTQAVSSAAEVAVMILRIDDVIVNEKPPAGKTPAYEGLED